MQMIEAMFQKKAKEDEHKRLLKEKRELRKANPQAYQEELKLKQELRE
jgi:hypothetical protein